MITFGRSYIVDGKAFASLRDAQQAALEAFFGRTASDLYGAAPDTCVELIEALLSDADAVVNILTTKETSLPKARKANGGTKRRPPTTKQPLVETP